VIIFAHSLGAGFLISAVVQRESWIIFRTLNTTALILASGISMTPPDDTVCEGFQLRFVAAGVIDHLEPFDVVMATGCYITWTANRLSG